MSRERFRFLRLGGAALLVLSFGCGRGGQQSIAAESNNLKITIPSQILGLTVQLEKPAKDLDDVERPYFDAIALFSLREKDLLRASLEIGRFNSLARPKSRSFRDSILGKIGSRAPREVRVGDQTVYITAGNQQNIFVWFRGGGIFVMVTHQEYSFPRTLLRRILNLDVQL